MSKYRIIGGFLALAACALLAPPEISAETYYVKSANGDDANDGKSSGLAFATIARAAEVATSGDTVYVGNGTYTDPIYVVGAKGSSALKFVADNSFGSTAATNTGQIIISGAPFRVAGSNYVELSGFTFNGGAAYPVIWEDSYNGKLTNCVFSGTSESVLLKDGSLELDSCTLTGFTNDAIQVDGEARLTVTDSTISGSGGHGIDIRKSAITKVVNTSIVDNTSNGIHFDLRDDSITLTDVPAVGCECTGTTPLNLKQQAYNLLQTVQPADTVFDAALRLAETDIAYGTNSSLWSDDEWHVDIASGPTVYEKTADAITKIEAVLTDDVDFDIIGDEIKVNHPYVATVTVIGTAITSGSDPVPVTLKFKVGDDTIEPFGDFDTESGDVNDGNNPRSYTTTETYEADDSIVVTGRSWWAGSPYLTVDSTTNSGHVYVLRNGDAVPNIAGYNGQASAEEFLRDYISSDDVVTLEDNQAIMLYELGTTSLSSSAADFQDLVVLVSLQRSASTPLTDAEIAALQQVLDLLLQADQALAKCAYDEANEHGGASDALAESLSAYNSGDTDYAAGSNVSASQNYSDAWEAAKKSVGNQEVDYGSTLATDILPQKTSEWSDFTTAATEVTGSTFTGNDIAVYCEDDHVFSTSTSDYSTNDSWGLSLKGQTKIDTCTVNTNGTGGLRLTGLEDGDFGFYKVTLADNVDYGVFLDSCTLTVDSSVYDDWTVSGSNYVLGSNGGTLTLDGISVSGGAIAGVYTHQGTLAATGVTFSGNAYGLTLSSSSGTLSKCTFASNTIGLVANSNTSVDVSDCTLNQNDYGLFCNLNDAITITSSTANENKLWGAVIIGKASFMKSEIASNTNGVYLANSSTGDLVLQSTAIRDNTTYGLHFEGCNLTVSGQASDGWQTLRNGYGISGNASTLTLTDPIVEDAKTYGMYFSNSTVTVSGGTVAGVSGVSLLSNNYGFTAQGTKFTATTSSGNSGVIQAGGNLTLRNCLLNGFATGAELNSGAGSSSVQYVTVVNAGATGLTVSGGSASVNNSIICGSGTNGISLTGGSLTHTHNIVHGFTTAFSGTTAHSSELVKTPRFVNAAGGDYHLSSASPAINAGTDLGITNPTDIEGNSRPSFHGHEIGAYEYTSDVSSFRVLDWQEQK